MLINHGQMHNVPIVTDDPRACGISQSDCYVAALCKNSWTDRGLDWVGDSWNPWNIVLDGGSCPSQRGRAFDAAFTRLLWLSCYRCVWDRISANSGRQSSRGRVHSASWSPAERRVCLVSKDVQWAWDLRHRHCDVILQRSLCYWGIFRDICRYLFYLRWCFLFLAALRLASVARTVEWFLLWIFGTSIVNTLVSNAS